MALRRHEQAEQIRAPAAAVHLLGAPLPLMQQLHAQRQWAAWQVLEQQQWCWRVLHGQHLLAWVHAEVHVLHETPLRLLAQQNVLVVLTSLPHLVRKMREGLEVQHLPRELQGLLQQTPQ